MQLRYYPTYNYVSITSPKAGSTLVNRIHDSISRNKQSFIYNEVKDLKKIMVGRDPYTRCLSAYYNKFLTLKKEYMKSKGCYVYIPHKKKVWQNCYSAFYIETTTGKSPTELDCNTNTGLLKSDYTIEIDDSFKSYVKFLKKSIDENKWFVNNAHFLPQVNTKDDNIFDDNLILVKLEEKFDEEFLDALQVVLPADVYNNYLFKVCELLNTTPNKTLNRLSLEGNEYLNYNSVKLISLMKDSIGLPSIHNMLDSETIGLINDIYHNDFVYLKYKYYNEVR